MAGFQLEGLEDVLKNLKKIQDKVQKKTVEKALKKSAKIVANAAKENAKRNDDPETASNISKNIVIRSGKIADKNSVKVRVGVKGGGKFWERNKNVQRKGKKRQKNPHYTPLENDTRHFWLVEFGTAKTLAFPFLRPALEDNIQNVTDDFAQNIKQEIIKVAN